MNLSILTSTATVMNPAVSSAISTTLTSVLELVLLAVTSLVGLGVKLWINSMNSGWKKTVATRLVSYAEQKFVNNPEKIKYVTDQLTAHFPRIDPTEASHLIEEAVVNLKANLPS